MKQLIINADDFGLHETVNIGIIKGHTVGSITSTTIMPNGNAFEHAVALASTNKQLGIGVHLTLVGGGSPVCRPEQVQSLVNGEGKLSSHYPQFLLRYISGKVQLADVRRELIAQVQKAVDSGLAITHLDSHQHMHILPGIIDITIDIAKEFNIPSVRIPAEPYFFIGEYPYSIARFVSRAGLTFLSQIASLKIKKHKLFMPDHFFGMLAGGNMCEPFLTVIVENLPDGISEIMMHPGTDNDLVNTMYNWNLHGQEELAAVTSDHVRQRLADKRVQLISFRDLGYD